MKKNILLLIGLSIALMVNASNIPQVVHELGYVFQDPFTCKYDLVVKSTLDKPAYTAYYYYYGGGQPEQPFEKQKDSLTLSLDRGYCTIIVAAGNNQVINSPARKVSMGNEGEVPPEDLPIPWDFYVEQYDVYNVIVLHPIVEHYDTIYANILTQKANFDLYSSFGGEEDGKAYCGDMYYARHCEIFKEDFSYLSEKPFKDMPYSLELESGDYVYYVNTGAPRINAPARNAAASVLGYPIPTSYSLDDAWTDVFYIHVIEPDCYDNLVYTKWDDVLFVDNGGNAQGFERGDFVAYQWYNEEDPIDGNIGQWMRTQGEPEGRYYAEITTKDGKKIFSCPAEFDDLPQSEPLNQHKSGGDSVQKRLVNGRLLIQVEDAIYHTLGGKVR